MKKTFASLAALGFVLSATTAQAEAINIEYDDLNLATPAGQQVLAQRIDRAARAVCGVNEVRTGTRVRNTEARTCYLKAKNQAERQFAAVVEQHAKGG